MHVQDDALTRAVTALDGARRVAVLTGAGMSAASGLPTYRGIGGLYNGIEIEAGMPIEDLLHIYTLIRNPALAWKYIAQIETACRGAEPNAGHYLLARWQERFDLTIVTQNVDGFHLRAGSTGVIELHGRLGDLYCLDCDARFEASIVDDRRLPPRCSHCDGLVRPNVVLFGEMLPPDALAAYERELARGFDVMLAVGTTAGFPYIHDPVVQAGRAGCCTIEINPDETPLSAHVSVRLAMPAVEALTALDNALNAATNAAASHDTPDTPPETSR